MLLFHLVCALGTVASSVHALPEVKVRGTTISGRDISNVEFFGGIPFAEPPVGALRLQPPVLKVQLNSTTFNAADYGKSCIQPLFWTYGGAFIIGSSTLYNGTELVQRSIQRVTIFGESAGAMMTGVLLLNPKLERLARGAILESGSSNGPSSFSAARNERSWQNFVGKVPSCASIASSGSTFNCLQSAPAPEIITAMFETVTLADLVWTPTLDTSRNSLYPDLPSRLYSKGRFARLPFIAGTNRDEGTLFASQQPLTDEALKAVLIAASASSSVSAGALGTTIDKVLELYPANPAVGSPYGTGEELFGLPSSYKRHASIMGDMTFDAPRRMWSQAAAKFGVKSYGYHFTDPQPVPALGVAHAAEIPYVYGQVPPAAGPASQNLSLAMVDYWISFTVSLDPNDGKGVKHAIVCDENMREDSYGGGYAVGSSHLNNGSEIVQRSIQRGTPIIYVNFNYRLGPLGFPQGQEADDQRALNLGIKDQIAALEWLQANIHFFGGDKHKVTVFGESAGAIMIGILLLNPRSERLARGAILQSGSSNGLATFTAAQQEASWKAYVGKIPSCASAAASGSTLSCFQNATVEEITTALVQGLELGDLYFAPTLDSGRNSLFPDLPSRIYSKGHFARLPFIAGTNLDEGTQFASQQPLAEEDLKAMLVAINAYPGSSTGALETTTSKLLELYPADPAVGSPYRTGDELFGLPASYKRHSSILGDMIFEAPRRMLSQSAAKFGVRSYAYQFTDPQAIAGQGVYHTAEIPYVYGQLPQTANGASQNLSLAMVDYWISFTTSLDPNDRKGVKRPTWPQYEFKNQKLLQLEGGNTTVVLDRFRKEAIEFLNSNALVLSR
ncbi:hypothetical protein MD484_g4211, partial [Candolleomyces efflorescens]